MSGRPRVYLTQQMPEDGQGLAMLRKSCDLIIYDEKAGGQVAVPRAQLLRDVAGVDALLMAYPATVNAELLDAAGIPLNTLALLYLYNLWLYDFIICVQAFVYVGDHPSIKQKYRYVLILI